MVNVTMLSALLAYDLTSLTYKPIPGSNASLMAAGPNFNSSQAAGGSIAQASVNAYAAQRPLDLKATHQLPNNASDSTSANVPSTSSSSCDVEPYDAPPITGQTFEPYDQTTANVYRYRQQQSVNLGSWFVHENWMTPSVFKCAAGPQVAEIDIANGWGSLDGARAVLERHWDTFINESDFQYLASIGINTVRLPIGYWNLGPDFLNGTAFEPVAQVYQNCWPRVLRAVNWAADAGIGVLIDLHGAVGSQNGQPHSGVSDGKTGMLGDPDNERNTIAVLTFLAEQFASVNNVVGIQILNEPQYTDALTPFYTQAIEAIRATTLNARTMPLYLHDGFDLDRLSTYVANRTDFVVQDHHSYFVFSPADQQESGTQHTSDVEGAISQSLLSVSRQNRRNLVVDEWSCALTPQSLEGDGNAVDVRKTFCTDQMRVYENTTAGWGFWAYKKEDCVTDPGWCFTAAVGKSLPHTFFTYRNTGAKNQAYNSTSDLSDNLIMPIVSSTSVLNLIGRHQTKKKAEQPNLASRFRTIHARRDASGANSSHAAAMNASTTRGYTDGMTTAKEFANHGSRLGFVGQFIMDVIKVLGDDLLTEGTEHGYHSGFVQGLKEAEAKARAG